MNKQVIKGWVKKEYDNNPEIYLTKNKLTEEELRTVDIANRNLANLVLNALTKLGYKNISEKEEDFENGIIDKRVIDNVMMEIYASDKQEKLNNIQEKVILDSMGLLNFQENWYGYSTWTIEGYEIDTFKLGGHNILEIIRNLEGKYIYLIIGI